MNSYEGPGTIITSDGELDAHVRFFVDTSGPIKDWGGTFTVDNLNPMIINEDDLRLRLPDGREGKILVTNTSVGSDDAEFKGSGAPPIDVVG